MKSNKIYIVAAICLVAGIALFTGGFAMLNFDVAALDTEGPYIEKNFVSSETVTALRVADSNVNVVLSVSSDENVRVTYSESDKWQYEISNDNGVLDIVKKTPQWFNYVFNIQLMVPQLLISVPKNFAGDISLETSNSAISTKNITAKNMRLMTSNASMNAKDISVSGKIELINSNGGITLEQADLLGDISARTSNASIRLREVNAGKITAENSNGFVGLESVAADKEIFAKTSNSAIEIGVTFGTGLICQNSNGRISGTVGGNISDYSIKSQTSNAKNNLPESLDARAKSIDITTSNGDIDINFAE